MGKIDVRGKKPFIVSDTLKDEKRDFSLIGRYPIDLVLKPLEAWLSYFVFIVHLILLMAKRAYYINPLKNVIQLALKSQVTPIYSILLH